MNRLPFLAIALFVGAFTFPAHAQDAMEKEAAVKPADPELKVVLDSWNDVGRKLIAMAEDFPEDKYDFKPTPGITVYPFRSKKVARSLAVSTPAPFPMTTF
jgi:hypothetical protein